VEPRCWGRLRLEWRSDQRFSILANWRSNQKEHSRELMSMPAIVGFDRWRIDRRAGLLCVIGISLVVAGCGGGGSAGADADPVSTALSYRLSATSVSMHADTSDDSAPATTISFTVENFDKRPSDRFVVSGVTSSGVPVSSASSTFLTTTDTTATGSITI